jgi:HEAT repeat protein
MLKSIQAMESPEALDALMRLTTSNVSEDTRKEIYSAISELIGTLSENDKLDKEKLAAIESELTQNLIKAEGAEVGNISDALSSINQDSVRNTLREEIARRSDVSQRLALASALAGNYSAFDLEMPAEQSNYLMEMTKEYASSRYDEEIRIKAISLLRTIGGDQSIEFLQTLSNDSNLRIRSLANKLIKS